MKQLQITAVLVLVALIAAGSCSRNRRDRNYRYINKKSGTISGAIKSGIPIDRYETYQVYFMLEKEVDAVKIAMTSKYIEDTLVKKETRLKTYFVLEKMIDISHFSQIKDRFTSYELGKNFDDDWRREQELTIFSSKSEPMKKLDNRSTYRIRFTTFSEEQFNYTVAVHADCNVIFRESLK